MLPETVRPEPVKALIVPVPEARISAPPPPETAPEKAEAASTIRVSPGTSKRRAVPPSPAIVPKLSTVDPAA